ncbi:hypothetical protein GCM10018980_76250 [Streptomyces capoamus]|uniref:DNA alkylation repair protein n=1 Tax=Streptomyces capoamus TaxID=68183 RepID=A0A919F3Y1_9ACTN|nr:DNA alkylation repair protein [Streptomyces capoamus]GGW13100.1 hypothetical protein GCM10010501_15290 [Streptomyces libani subsp. rufus]GHG77746.1 hypothetical protein GCM10018980_76250 [Streptomyces capoamus]
MSLPHHRLAEAADQLTEQLVRLGTPEHAAWDRDYLRSDFTHLGVPAVHGAGAITLQHKGTAGTVLDRWAIDQDFWLRRSALLALLPGIRADAADLKRLSRYADAMLEEPEFFIRKAIGWVLRETIRSDHQFVTTWLESRIDRISGLTLREAVRRLHDTDRTRLTNPRPLA